MKESVRTEDLTRTFRGEEGEIKALDGVSLSVMPGEIFGLLGPNGAGKTTLTKILCTLLLPTSGKAFVNGYDVVQETAKIKEVINLASGGETPGYGILTVRENLWFFSQLYGLSNEESKKRVSQLIDAVGLQEKAKERMNRLSSGMKQRLNIARSMINDPRILFLDEPTLGLDVVFAQEIRQYIEKLVKVDPEKTVLLTTHYMAEADEMCDRVAIIDKGKIIVVEAPARLKSLFSKDVNLLVEVSFIGSRADELLKLKGVKGLSVTHSPEKNTTTLKLVLEEESVIPDVISAIKEMGVTMHMMNKAETTLETVFISLVGRGLE
jgi:ABC-2 type transport system ATP-binding protein